METHKSLRNWSVTELRHSLLENIGEYNKVFSMEKIKYYEIKTVDRRNVVLTRVKPRRAGGLFPLLCIPGLGQNRFSWMHPGSNFAEWFSLRGVDVWILEPRGCGFSKLERENYNWSVDEIIKYDLAASIKKVLKESGRSKVFLAGHSLGGCIIYCALPLYEEKIAGFISLGGPLKYKAISLGWFIKAGAVFNTHLRIFGKHPLEILPFFPLPLLGAGAVIGMPLLNTLLENMIPLHPWHRKNIRKRQLIKRILKGFEKVSPKVVSQFLRWADEGRLTSYDRNEDYTKGFLRAKVPGLFIAGDRDRLAPPSSVEHAFKLYRFKDKKFIVLNQKEHGVHWGHLDLTMGKNCESYLFPLILNWMIEKSERKSPSLIPAQPSTGN